MANFLAIAAVTAALRERLVQVATPQPVDVDNELADTQITTQPPDKAGAQEDRNQLNLYLYQVGPNAVLRNVPDARAAIGPPALALDLYYILTAYGRNSDESLTHRLLGRAMTLLHSAPFLSSSEVAAVLAASNLQLQSELIKIVPMSLATEELFRLWSTFQTKYRLSSVYRVSAVLMESAPVVAPPQVTERRVTVGVASEKKA